jgi:hypothetical protein
MAKRASKSLASMSVAQLIATNQAVMKKRAVAEAGFKAEQRRIQVELDKHATRQRFADLTEDEKAVLADMLKS